MNASLIKELRDLTGAGMMDCKKALEENNGDLQLAMDWLREKGISKAAKKADRIAAEGLSAVLTEGDKAVIIEVNCETDFVAKNDKFKALLELITKTYINSDAKTLEELLAVATENGTINDVIISHTATIGEKISLRRAAKLEKSANEVFGTYLHMGGKIAVLTLLTGTDEAIAKDVAMHSAAMRPLYVSKEEVPASEVEREKEILKEQAMNEGKPAAIAEKMVIGRIAKFYKEICVEEQDFVKNGDVTVGAYVASNNHKIKNMIRFEVGEGMEKRQDNFAEEVMSQIK